jgi:hypothetical protein
VCIIYISALSYTRGPSSFNRYCIFGFDIKLVLDLVRIRKPFIALLTRCCSCLLRSHPQRSPSDALRVQSSCCVRYTAAGMGEWNRKEGHLVKIDIRIYMFTISPLSPLCTRYVHAAVFRLVFRFIPSHVSSWTDDGVPL